MVTIQTGFGQMKINGVSLKVALLILLTTAVFFTLSDTVKGSEGYYYTVHVSSHKTHSNAEKSISQLRAKGYDAFYKRVNILGKGVWYRVYIGRWEDREKALSFGKRLKSAGIIDYLTTHKLKLDKRTTSPLPERAIRVTATSQDAGRRLALVIGNGAYKGSPLKNPVNDARDMAATLRSLGFEVIHKENADQKTMEEAIHSFGRKLRKGGVGLFYFAGHGMQVEGGNYLIPVDVHIESESDVRFEAVDAGRVLGKMEDAGNDLNIVILDACRDNPFARSFRSSTRGRARMYAPSGSFIAYATAPGSVAADGKARNGIFTAHLLQNMTIPDLKIEDVLKRVRNGVMRETGDKQVPWQSSSLTGDFYFVSKKATVLVERPEQQVSMTDTHLQKERVRLEQERQELERLKMKIETEKLQAERKRLESEKKRLEMAKLPPKPKYAPSVSKPNEIDRDGQFIAYDNGTVLDTKTGLMWAAEDNGKNISWHDAKRYCENYRGGGYSDWRMPTQDELEGLYDRSRSYQAKQTSYNVHLTELIQLTNCCPWASETRGSKAASFFFDGGYRDWLLQSHSYYFRALPVRAGN